MFFNKIPTTKEVTMIRNNIVKKNKSLVKIILNCEWNNKVNVNENTIEYFCFFIL